ncbi:hypothetical protein [Streptomyces sp. NPDC048644]|uniref:hypothetical protein n=1 Tax=Streptomyces sp. NPDC048644 TaxID=3365582 RepID=UPI003718F95E
MDAELTALAAAGATTLVQQMATDGWAQARRRVAAFLARRRGTADEEAIEGELEASRAEVTAAQEAGEAGEVEDVTAAWRVRLRRLLRDDPEAAAELCSLLDELEPERGGVTVREVHNTISGGELHGTVIQAGVISGFRDDGSRSR